VVGLVFTANVSGQNAVRRQQDKGKSLRMRCSSAGPPRDAKLFLMRESRMISAYSKFAAPYDTNYTRQHLCGRGARYSGAKNLKEIRIGFFGRLSKLGVGSRTAMLHGAQLASKRLMPAAATGQTFS